MAERIVRLQREFLSYQVIGALLTTDSFRPHGSTMMEQVTRQPCAAYHVRARHHRWIGRTVRRDLDEAGIQRRSVPMAQRRAVSGQLRILPCTGVGKYQDFFVSGSILAMDSSSLSTSSPTSITRTGRYSSALGFLSACLVNTLLFTALMPPLPYYSRLVGLSKGAAGTLVASA